MSVSVVGEYGYDAGGQRIFEDSLDRGSVHAYWAGAVLERSDSSDTRYHYCPGQGKVLYATGIRRGELQRLTVYAIDSERGTLSVRQGKNKKDRIVPLGERAAAWVERYVQTARAKLVLPPEEGALFVTNMGEAFSAMALSELVRKYIDASGVNKSGSCHLFRHTCATLMLEGGADVRYIQAILGHARLDTTMIYTCVGIRRLAEIHAATHPGVKIIPSLEASREGEGVGEEEE